MRNSNIGVDDVYAVQGIGRRSVSKFKPSEIRKAQKWARMFYKDLKEKSPFFRAWFGDWRQYDTSPVKVVAIPEIGIDDPQLKDLIKLQKATVLISDTKGNGTDGWRVRISKNGIENTKSHSGKGKKSVIGLLAIQKLLENAVLLDSEVHEHHSNNAANDMITFDHKLYALGKNVDGIALYKITVEDIFQSTANQSDKRFHNLRYITEIELVSSVDNKKTDDPAGSSSHQVGEPYTTDSSSSVNYSVANLFEFVKRYDPEFKSQPVSEEMIENGLPKKFYHGSNEIFTVFDMMKSGKNFGEVSEGLLFFTDKKEAWPNSASDYARYAVEHGGGSEQIYEVYLQMRRPLVIDAGAAYDAIAYFDAHSDEIYMRYMSGNYDGILIKQKGGATLAIIDNPSQVKSATDNVGTFDTENPNIRYSIDIDDIADDPEQIKEIKLRSDILRDQLKLTDGTRRSVLRKSAAVGS